jgi:hypothetical protein
VTAFDVENVVALALAFADVDCNRRDMGLHVVEVPGHLREQAGDDALVLRCALRYLREVVLGGLESVESPALPVTKRAIDFVRSAAA